ncbi:ABC-type cobalamin/Fe3+-siderophore transport system, ATPase component [Saccharomonospora marina XMU15]|uniref:ABC-type cobalamin/Fe3+-siderophore transport system, ATPase component n=1 Tax=Saccharomonospora marina XMU15 TaxID=882083 RepID=H5WWV8_9PSEU|nr:ABC transporter ATP-binding protein [Saccharomonospora marina]EHR52786.1 ABC-type cobalamin/Fe3+-siderophore transport system, ATPase component [Saccharomonospora marina XMU15]
MTRTSEGLDQQLSVAAASSLRAERLRVGYGADRMVIEQLDLQLPAGAVTAVIGANGSGKSTLLRTLARLLWPSGGQVLLDGRDVHRMRTRDVARKLGLLPQAPTTPESITVRDLVRRGRTPHTSVWRQWSEADEKALLAALASTDLADLADEPVDTLSGGQRQRAWLALVIAQNTPWLLLDEPTTFLDIAHQIDVLELVRRLNRDHGRTVVMVLHDLNQASRYADHLVALRAGAVVATGAPVDVVTEELVTTVFDVRARIVPDPVAGSPLVVPVGRAT